MTKEKAFAAIASALLDQSAASSDEHLAYLDALSVIADAASLPVHARQLAAVSAALHAAERAQLDFLAVIKLEAPAA